MPRTTLFLIITVPIVLLTILFFFPLSNVHWGNFALNQERTITVTGVASAVESNKVASFYAGADETSDDKDGAINRINSKMENLLSALSTFGIPKEDIQTSNMSVNQNQESYYEEGRQKVRPGQWRVSNSVMIKLRDIDRADELNELLINSGLTNVSGPNFGVDQSNTVSNELTSQAVDNAREKAQEITANQDLKLGKIISITEGSANSMIAFSSRIGFEGGGGGDSSAPGSYTARSSVVVVFEIK